MYRPYPSSAADARPFRDVESQLRDLTQDFATSFNTGNYDQAASLFTSDGVLMAPLHEGAYGQMLVERLLRHGDGDWTLFRGGAESGRDHDSGAREVCTSVASAGSVAADGGLLEPDADGGERSSGVSWMWRRTLVRSGLRRRRRVSAGMGRERKRPIQFRAIRGSIVRIARRSCGIAGAR
jgi:hypothetical protein